MKYRVFLDTNIFIYAFEHPDSNSAKIIGLLNKGVIDAVLSERAMKEVYEYFRKYHNKELADNFRRYMFEACHLALKYEVRNEMKRWSGEIKDKDLEQLATAKKLGVKLVSYDQNFEKFNECLTPKQFLKEYGCETMDTEY